MVGGGLRASESLQEPTGNQAELHFHSIEMKRDQNENSLQSQEVFLTCQPSFCSKYNQDLSMSKAGVLHDRELPEVPSSSCKLVIVFGERVCLYF